MEDQSKIILSVMNTLNVFLTGILIISYFTSRQLQGHPGGIIVSIAFCELATSYHSSIFTWGSGHVVSLLTIDKMRIWGFVGLKDHVFNVTCGVNLTMITFGIISGLFYNLILSVDLILSLRNPFGVASRRMPWYHLLVALASLGLAGYITVNSIINTCQMVECNKEFFKTTQEYHSCLTSHGYCDEDTKDFNDCAGDYENKIQGFENQDKLEFIEEYKHLMIPLFGIYAVVGLLSAIYGIFEIQKGFTLSNVALKNSLTRHILYLAISTLMFGFMAFSLYIRDKDDDGALEKSTYEIASYVFSLGGVLLAIVRFMNKDFRYKIMKGKLFVKEFEGNDDQDDNEWNESSLNTLTELKADLVNKIFHGLYTAFKDSSSQSQRNDRPRSMPVLLPKDGSTTGNQNLMKNEAGIMITQYCNLSFSKIIEKFANYNDFETSFNPKFNEEVINNASESKGKSGSFFVVPKDKKFLVKTVKASEIKVLKKMASDYAKYLEENKEKSMLCRIFGAFQLNIPGKTPINLIIMENINSGIEIEKIYDLKGSTLGRYTKDLGKGDVINDVGPFKDIDFIRSQVKIEVNPEKEKDLHQNIENDTNLLKKFHLMDYSLLVCIGTKKDTDGEIKPVIVYRIIDYLIKYQFFKKLERAFVTLLNPRTKDKASVMDPSRYAERFKSFMKKKVFKLQENDQKSPQSN